MASLSAINNWNKQGSLTIQLMVSIITFLILLCNFISKKVFTIAVITFFLINTIANVLSVESVEKPPQKFKSFSIESAVKGKKIEKKNDVLLLVYESYSNYETMQHYGFDNSEQLDFLEQNGFHVYHGIYSLGTGTISSMSRVFNVERKLSGRKFLAGGGAVHRLLNNHGYKTLGVFQNDYNFRGLSIDEVKYDFHFPAPVGCGNLLINAILGGEFSDEVSFEGVGVRSYLKQKRKVLMRRYPSPVFMYSHSLRPGHRPKGAKSPDEVDKYINIILDLVKQANIEMQQDINTIIKHNSNAIIIIAGDHGPLLTKIGYDIHHNPDKYSANDIDRYIMQDIIGAFLAIRWPENNYANKHDIKILQDIFPAVFAYLFDDDSIFDKTRIQPRTMINSQITCGVNVNDGIIIGGKDDGKPLFEGVQ